jgi:hypothetical protein
LDAGLFDAGSAHSDAAVGDASTPDTGMADTGTPDTGTPDTGTLPPVDPDADGGVDDLGCGVEQARAKLGHHRGVDCGSSFTPSQVVAGDDGVTYLLSIPERRVFAWSAISGSCLAPILLGEGATHVAYSSVNRRLYVAYSAGHITVVDPSTGVEQPFATLPTRPSGLACAGRYVLTADETGSWGTHYTFTPGGELVSSVDWNRYSREYAWSPSSGRMYFFRDNSSPNDLHWEHIDCATGSIDGAGESPYHGDYTIAGPIRVSPDGSRVLLGAGEIYDGTTTARVASLPDPILDAAWLATGELLILRAAGTGTLVEQREPTRFRITNQQLFAGKPLALRALGDGAVVITDVATRPTFSVYHANVDGDGDGIATVTDAFPLDPTAAVDSDWDGYPDAWNPGANPATSALSLDAFPHDSACHTSQQGQAGDPARCDIEAAVPRYTPNAIAFAGGQVVYMLAADAQRVFRYAASTGAALNPLVLRARPSRMAYSPAHARIYLAYPDGSITSIAAAGGRESDFTTLAYGANGLVAVGAYMLAADSSGAWATHFTFDAAGNELSAVDWNYVSGAYEWSAANERVYFFRDDTSPNDLHWERIDQATGRIAGEGESPYHGDYLIRAPIRVSADGARVLLGSGDIYDGAQLQRQSTLSLQPLDAVWRADGSLVVLTADGMLRWYDSALVPGKTSALPATPLRLLLTASDLIAVTSNDGKPVLTHVAF